MQHKNMKPHWSAPARARAWSEAREELREEVTSGRQGDRFPRAAHLDGTSFFAQTTTEVQVEVTTVEDYHFYCFTLCCEYAEDIIQQR